MLQKCLTTTVQLESNIKTLNSTIDTFNRLKEAELTATKQSLENTYSLQKKTLEAEFKPKETQLTVITAGKDEEIEDMKSKLEERDALIKSLEDKIV